MSMEALARFVSCSACGESIDENDASTPYTIVKGEHVHLRCSVVTEISAQYAKEVREYLTTGKNATRPATAHPLLDEEETEELLQCYLLSVPAIEFAKRLENRDISDFERASDPYPQREYPEVPMN